MRLKIKPFGLILIQSTLIALKSSNDEYYCSNLGSVKQEVNYSDSLLYKPQTPCYMNYEPQIVNEKRSPNDKMRTVLY